MRISIEEPDSVDFSAETTGESLPPTHPGDILRDMLEELELTEAYLAQALKIPSRRIHEIVRGQCALSADTALRLGRYFGTSAEFWMNLQSRYDLETARYRLGRRLFEDVRQRAA